MSLTKYKNHIAFTASSDIAELCLSLRKNLDMNMFCYHKIFNDGSEIMLSDDIVWTENFYQNQYLMGNDAPEIATKDFKCTLWPFDNHLPILKEVRDICGVYYGITLKLISKDYHELFGFGAKSDLASAPNFFINNIDLFERFSLFFRSQAADIIKKCDFNKIIASNINKPAVLKRNNSLQLRRKGFIADTELRRNRAKITIDGFSFSARELDCIRCILLGKTAQEIGERLFISARTVETHIDNIKIKLNCHKKSELVAKLLKSGCAQSLLACEIGQGD